MGINCVAKVARQPNWVKGVSAIPAADRRRSSRSRNLPAGRRGKPSPHWCVAVPQTPASRSGRRGNRAARSCLGQAGAVARTASPPRTAAHDRRRADRTRRYSCRSHRRRRRPGTTIAAALTGSIERWRKSCRSIRQPPQENCCAVVPFAVISLSGAPPCSNRAASHQHSTICFCSTVSRQSSAETSIG